MPEELTLYKLVVLGPGGVGKSAIVIQLCLNQFTDAYDPTIEDSYRKQVVVDGQNCMLEVLDTAGQEEYTALRDQWIRDGEAFVLVYSVSSRYSFSRITTFHNQIQRVKESLGGYTASYPGSSISIPIGPVPVMLLGNQGDRVTEREVSTQEGAALARELGCEFMECSAKASVNIEKGFYDLIRMMRRQRLQPQPDTQLSAQSTSTTRESRLPRPTKRRFWMKKKIYIPANEGDSEEGRQRLTISLVKAARANKEREAIAYLEAGAHINSQPGSDGAAIHAASASGHANIVNLLLKKGAAINARGPSGTSPMQVAAAEGHIAVVRLLLHKGAQIDQTSQLHGTALSAAASRGRTEVVQLLLKKRANVNAEGGPYKYALQAAAWVGKASIVEALLDAGADINARGHGDCTALQMASSVGNSAVIRVLLRRGGAINIDAPGGKYGCALKAANDHGHFEAVTILLDNGASPEVLETPREERIDVHASEDQEEQSTENARIARELSNISLATQPPASSGSQRPTPISVVESPVQRPSINPLGFSDVYNPEGANIDIVFVHGLEGHPEKTWTYPPPTTNKKRFFRSFSGDLPSRSQQETIFWPYDLLSKDPDLARARILTWGYDTLIISEFFGTSDQQNISQHGNNLMVALQQERKNDPTRPLLFVAHSLGGILVKVALENSKNSTHQPQYLPIYSSTKGIIFLGTPHGGSSSANWGILASNLAKVALQGPNERVLRGLRPNNELLENLRKVFLQMLEDSHFQIHSFYETQSMLGIYGLRDRASLNPFATVLIVVPYESALVGHARQEIVRGIHGNHVEICRFGGGTDPGYRAVLGALEDYIKEATNRYEPVAERAG
ncbi:hypothetical protein MMC30_002538 [Trapelia coarctata]|nr:hypothetical protein [Trapelia coarctata]